MKNLMHHFICEILQSWPSTRLGFVHERSNHKVLIYCIYRVLYHSVCPLVGIAELGL
jgi:hypothetical protein